jgi:thiamine-phosphate pyrophosphorylase
VLRYTITDRTLCTEGEPARHEALLQQAGRLAATNVDYLQLREKDMPAAALADLAREILAIFRKHNASTKLLINSRADIAIAAHADGVHLTSAPGALTPAQVRQLYAHAGLPAPILSLSRHTLDEVACAAGSPQHDRPDLILFGPVFEKRLPTQALPGTGTGLELLAAVCRAAGPIPVLALGGVTEQNSPACLSAGAAGIAAIRLFLR